MVSHALFSKFQRPPLFVFGCREHAEDMIKTSLSYSLDLTSVPLSRSGVPVKRHQVFTLTLLRAGVRVDSAAIL